MSPPRLPASPDKLPGEAPPMISTTNSALLSNVTGPAINHYEIKSTEHLKTFISTFCDRQTIDMTTMIRSSIKLFNYCIPSREAILVFYGELFSEYSTYYWITKKRASNVSQQTGNNSTSDNRSQPIKGKIEYVGELTRRFYEIAKLKLADEREDQDSDVEIASQLPSPSKSIPNPLLTGPASPSGSSQNCSSPTHRALLPSSGPKVIPITRRTSSCNSTSDSIDQTPMSPSTQEIVTDDTNNFEEDACYDTDETNAVDIFSELESLIAAIETSVLSLMARHVISDEAPGNSTDDETSVCSSRLRSTLVDWATELLLSLNSKHYQISLEVATKLNKASPTNLLTRQINLWTANPVNKLLIDLLLESRGGFNDLFGRIIASTDNCDWLIAYMLLEMSKRPNCDQDFAKSMEFLIGSQSNINSLTYILAYLSDNNPKAMTNFPKSNIPFLVSLCQSSISLLNVLCLEIPDEISPSFLNNLAREVYSKGNTSCIESLTHCIIAAPNAYKLFSLTFDAVLDKNTSQEVKSAAETVIYSISSRIHHRATQTAVTQTNLMPNPHFQLIDGLLNQINNDLSKLIRKSCISKYVARKTAFIFYRMSLIFGHSFASKIICHYLNLPKDVFWPLLKPILNKFMQHFGDDGSTLVSQTLSIDSSLRTPVYWINLNALVNKYPDVKLDLDLISQLLADKLCAATFDMHSTAQLIKLCCSSLEKVDQTRINIGTKHKLCRALATCFFLLLGDETSDLPEVLGHIRISLTCMSLLKQSTVASHILCRALLERSLVYGNLFNKKFNPDLIGCGLETAERVNQDALIKLAKENLKVSLGHRFRRLPYHERTLSTSNQINGIAEIARSAQSNGKKSEKQCDSDEKPDRQSINSYLLIEAFKSSINNIEAFASLFVEFHCPVMFDKHLWPSDEALRVINERNLSILRKFEQVPPFWDIFDFIGQAKCLKNCLVLVKALLAAHLALWASATTNSSLKKMQSTSRLIPPLAHSGLVPRAFGLTVEVFPNLSPNEVFSVLSDIWQYLKFKDTNQTNGLMESPTLEAQRATDKLYLNRLRLFMCQHMPGPTYVKIFKEFYEPTEELATPMKIDQTG